MSVSKTWRTSSRDAGPIPGATSSAETASSTRSTRSSAMSSSMRSSRPLLQTSSVMRISAFESSVVHMPGPSRTWRRQLFPVGIEPVHETNRVGIAVRRPNKPQVSGCRRCHPAVRTYTDRLAAAAAPTSGHVGVAGFDPTTSSSRRRTGQSSRASSGTVCCPLAPWGALVQARATLLTSWSVSAC
jgi:hypothetical protein